MPDTRDYITWVNRKTQEKTSLIDKLLVADQSGTGGANKSHIEGLKPYEQYAIYLSLIQKENMPLTSVNEMFESYVKHTRKKGRALVTKDVFVRQIQEKSSAVLVRIGEKDYFLGIGLRET